MEVQRPKEKVTKSEGRASPTALGPRGDGDRELLLPVGDEGFEAESDYVNDRPEPSAPPAEPDSFNSGPSPIAVKARQRFLQKLYTLIMAQMSIFGALTALFVYIPHLRKIFRKKVFDQLFLNSFLGFPLGLCFILLVLFPELRRRFAWISITVLTSCLSLLLAYLLAAQSTKVLLANVIASDLCCLGVVSLSSIPGVDLTTKKGLFYYPTFMALANGLYPKVLGFQYSQTVIPAIVSTSMMTYLGYNTRSIVRSKRLKLQRDEYAFSASQIYMNFDLVGSIERYLTRRH